MVAEQIISALEDFKTLQCKLSVSVLPYVGVACLGAILFGYHLGVVNGALDYLSNDLGIFGNTVLQGWVVSTLLARCQFILGGSLGDKFGGTKTFQLDAIPLTIGAFVCAITQSVQTMVIGRLLCGIGMGISSALVPLYIYEISPTEVGVHLAHNQLFDRHSCCISGWIALGRKKMVEDDVNIAVVPSFCWHLGWHFV
ncbi:hypothetical protein Nepgr_025918 [Nepenthes gracilis]|uniref:Major facilitator superfamily (MFS) profile domain-containing protein n=1 Tax=Nepenthes gracilis TaxID=150966 RepID=A0AAD3Y1K2_NEPGR|nr:hypothetical protein Nepgr_025918 [Nepenthes gracilis]